MGARKLPKQRRNRTAKRPSGRLLSIALVGVEIHKGHDGLLRGHPECVFVFAMFAVPAAGGAGEVALLGRVVWRVNPRGRYPIVLGAGDLAGQPALEARIGAAASGSLVGLVVACEEDRGADVRAVYEAMAEPSTLALWSRDDDVPSPGAMGARAWGRPAPRCEAVHVLRRGTDLRDLCRVDQLVGVAAFSLDAGAPADATWRAHVASDDGRNDWIAVMTASLPAPRR